MVFKVIMFLTWFLHLLRVSAVSQQEKKKSSLHLFDVWIPLLLRDSFFYTLLATLLKIDPNIRYRNFSPIFDFVAYSSYCLLFYINLHQRDQLRKRVHQIMTLLSQPTLVNNTKTTSPFSSRSCFTLGFNLSKSKIRSWGRSKPNIRSTKLKKKQTLSLSPWCSYCYLKESRMICRPSLPWATQRTLSFSRAETWLMERSKAGNEVFVRRRVAWLKLLYEERTKNQRSKQKKNWRRPKS